MKKKLLVIAIILTMVFSLASCGKFKKDKDSKNPSEASESSSTEDLTDLQAEFAAFVDEQYKLSMEESYIATHIYYIDPEAAGIDMSNVEVSFGTAGDEESMEEDRTFYRSLLEALEGFDREKLTRLQQDQYDALEWEIKSVLKLADEKFDYYAQYYAVPNSVDSNLISYLSMWHLRNEREVQDFILLVDSIPAYVDSTIEYAKKQQEKKLFMTDFNTVIENCEEVISLGMDSFIITRMLEEIENVKDLDAAAKEKYKKEVREAFKRSYLPAFETIKKAMEEMKGGYNHKGSFYDFPNGKEYYAALLNYSLGSYDVSVDDIMAQSKETSNELLEDLYLLYGKFSDKVNDFYINPPSTGYKDYDSILKDMEKLMLQDFPEVKNLEYQIQKADEEEKLDEKHVAAYFVIPPVDGDHMQQMRVNPSNTEMGSLDTYTTVTHEGFPGHMYQYSFIADNIESEYIKTLGIDGMVEGYAVYAQYSSLDYLKDVPNISKQLIMLNDKIGYLDYGYADMGIQYLGWGPEEVGSFFASEGYNLSSDTINEIYEFLRFTPAYYEPYGMGYQFIASERERAEEALGEKFEAKEFNRALLMAGPTPQVVVSRYIDENEKLC